MCKDYQSTGLRIVVLYKYLQACVNYVIGIDLYFEWDEREFPWRFERVAMGAFARFAASGEHTAAERC